MSKYEPANQNRTIPEEEIRHLVESGELHGKKFGDGDGESSS